VEVVMSMNDKNEIVMYQANDLSAKIEVNI
jgi:hypothetical protein